MTSVLLLIRHSLSLLSEETLDFVLIIDLRSGVIHGGSRDDTETVLTGIHAPVYMTVNRFFQYTNRSLNIRSSERIIPVFICKCSVKCGFTVLSTNPLSVLYNELVLTLYQLGE